jgi:alkyl hydroperoxide reductase subunit AhpC
MNRGWSRIVVCAVLLATVALTGALSPAVADERDVSPSRTLLLQAAPDFTAQAYHKGDFIDVTLSDFSGEWFVLFFYPLDFTFVCPTELRELAKHYKEFQDLGAEVLAASVDSVYTHMAWYETEPQLKDVAFPVLSDITHEIGKAYRVLHEVAGNHFRATFIIDPEGIIQYHVIHTEMVGRSIKELLRVLQALQTGGLCPVEWEPGEELLEPGR